MVNKPSVFDLLRLDCLFYSIHHICEDPDHCTDVQVDLALTVYTWHFFFVLHGISPDKREYQGPVVQSTVCLTSSLRVISLTVLADSIYNILIFFAEKMCVAFAMHHICVCLPPCKVKTFIRQSLPILSNGQFFSANSCWTAFSCSRVTYNINKYVPIVTAVPWKEDRKYTFRFIFLGTNRKLQKYSRCLFFWYCHSNR